MAILLVGSKGNMGRRYAAILDYLGKPYVGVDVDHPRAFIDSLACASDGILIATPTDTHAKLIRSFLSFGKPIMCEKPITKDVAELKTLFREIEFSHVPFRMIMQYEMLCDEGKIGLTRYDYFKHGNDGLYWDCLQLIALAKRQILLEEKSPIWKCTLNGKVLSLSHMDAAYIGYLQRWFEEPKQDLGFLIEAHEKAFSLSQGAALVSTH